MAFGPSIELPEVDLVPDASAKRRIECLADEAKDLANSHLPFGPPLLPTAGEQAIHLNELQPLLHRHHTPVSTAELQKSFSLTDEGIRLIPKIIRSGDRFHRPFRWGQWGRHKVWTGGDRLVWKLETGGNQSPLESSVIKTSPPAEPLDKSDHAVRLELFPYPPTIFSFPLGLRQHTSVDDGGLPQLSP
jgi:hypothetical protein